MCSYKRKEGTVVSFKDDHSFNVQRILVEVDDITVGVIYPYEKLFLVGSALGTKIQSADLHEIADKMDEVSK